MLPFVTGLFCEPEGSNIKFSSCRPTLVILGVPGYKYKIYKIVLGRTMKCLQQPYLNCVSILTLVLTGTNIKNLRVKDESTYVNVKNIAALLL